MTVATLGWLMTDIQQPRRAVEIERKYDVTDDTPLPVWVGLPGVTAVSEGEPRALDARYVDTPDASLARAGYALRRRTGGPDAGWHLKGPRNGDGRLELHWPLGDEGEVPAGIVEAIAPVSLEDLVPLARIENDRLAFLLSGPDGVIAEFVDDHVRATDMRTGVQRAWREWEFELGPGAPEDSVAREELFIAAERAIIAAGGQPPSSGSKLARALGF